MKNLRIIAVLALFVGFALPSETFATAQQVAQDTTLPDGPVKEDTKPGPKYGRSDGLFFDEVNIPWMILNGDGYSSMASIVPVYEEHFQYGSGLGVICESVVRPVFARAASADQACSATCGNSVCVFGFDDGTADAENMVACSGGSAGDADDCICMTTGLDLVLAGCGANWEAPALGVTKLHFPSGMVLAHAALLAQDIGPTMVTDGTEVANGLDIAGDLTANDGAELFGGMYGASGRPLFPGVDPAFRFCATVEHDDISGTDEFWVGFRSVESPNATFNDYNTYATIGVDNATGDVHTETEDDGLSLTTTDITLTAIADDEANRYCVMVSDTREVTYSIDGDVATDAVAFSFDSGEGVIPFIHFLHDTAVDEQIIISEWQVSYDD